MIRRFEKQSKDPEKESKTVVLDMDSLLDYDGHRVLFNFLFFIFESTIKKKDIL